MKRFLFLFLASLSMGMFAFAGLMPAKVGAVDVISDVCNQPTGNGERPAVCNTNENASNSSDDENPFFGPNGVVTRGIQILALVLGVIVVFVILINAVRLITANGDANTVTSARNGIIYALIGAVIAVSAQTLVALVLSRINT